MHKHSYGESRHQYTKDRSDHHQHHKKRREKDTISCEIKGFLYDPSWAANPWESLEKKRKISFESHVSQAPIS